MHHPALLHPSLPARWLGSQLRDKQPSPTSLTSQQQPRRHQHPQRDTCQPARWLRKWGYVRSHPRSEPLAPGTAASVRRPRQGGLGAGARQVLAAKWVLLQPSGFNRFPILYLSAWNFPGWGRAHRGMFDLETMSKAWLKHSGCRGRAGGHRRATRAAARTAAASGGLAPVQHSALTPVPPAPGPTAGGGRLWMQLGAWSVGGGARRGTPPAPRWASGRAGSH